MTLPVEIVVLLLTFNGAFLSFCVHLLIRINGIVGRMSKDTAVSEAQTKLRLDEVFRMVGQRE